MPRLNNCGRLNSLFSKLAILTSALACVAADEQPLGRQAVLLSAATTFAQRLRSVFVPYFRYLWEPLLAALDRPVTTRARKKRKKSKAAAEEDAAVAGGESSSWASESDWHCRVQVGMYCCMQLLLQSGQIQFRLVSEHCPCDCKSNGYGRITEYNTHMSDNTVHAHS